jgi:hypothetical protein
MDLKELLENTGDAGLPAPSMVPEQMQPAPDRGVVRSFFRRNPHVTHKTPAANLYQPAKSLTHRDRAQPSRCAQARHPALLDTKRAWIPASAGMMQWCHRSVDVSADRYQFPVMVERLMEQRPSPR